LCYNRNMNPQLNELADYIKKAREAGQPDQQTRQVLLKNQWSNAEIDEAFAAIPPNVAVEKLQPQSQLQAKPQERPQQEAQQTMQYRPQPQQTIETKQPRTGGGKYFGLKLFFAILAIALIIGAGAVGYFALDFSQYLPQSSPVTESAQPTQEEQQPPLPLTLESQILAVIPDEYDAAKISVAAFSKEGKKIIYCASLKTNAAKIACFENSQKLFDGPYSFKPYWVGVSPDEARVVFLFYDSVKKQSFVFENNIEDKRYDGKITYPVFSRDSRKLMFVVLANDGKNFVVLDNKPFAEHDKILAAPEFSPDNKYILYGATDGQNISRQADLITP